MTTAIKPTTILPDGSPMPMPVWSPYPVDKSGDKPAERARFPEGQPGRDRLEPSRPPVPSRVQGHEVPRSGAEGILAPGGKVAGGFRPPPVARGSGSAPQPLFVSPGKPANRCPRLERFVNAPPPVDMSKAYIEISPPPYQSKTPLSDALDAAFDAADLDDSDLVAGRKQFYCRMETQAVLMWREHHHMKDCLIYPQVDKDGVPLPPEVRRGKDGRLHRAGHKRCNCMGCVYCRLLHALAARKEAITHLKAWQKRGSFAVMVAPTFGHPDPTEPYIQMRSQFRAALTKMRHGEVWERFEQRWGLGEWHGDTWVSSAWMYSMEDMINVFYGFHPHQHAMYEIVASYVAAHPKLQTKEGRAAWIKAFQKAHYKLWESALQKVHRHASPTYGLVATLSALSDREVIAGVNYVTKAANELTGAPSKEGKHGSRDMYALLDDVADESLPDDQRDLAGRKYVEWQAGIRRKTRYFFSESHAKETGEGESIVPEVEDEPYTEVVVTLTPAQDQWLMRRRAWPTFLTLGERSGIDVAVAWLERFGPPPLVHTRPVFGEITAIRAHFYESDARRRGAEQKMARDRSIATNE